MPSLPTCISQKKAFPKAIAAVLSLRIVRDYQALEPSPSLGKLSLGVIALIHYVRLKRRSQPIVRSW
ncbi:MAG: hypothetical protein RMY28_013285 [Nostoc sp. ChiSLP01]|nr:hypothetical protein [Nostoc sp. CmiSLP01]MDZ8285619.1 hypothetical protein [Nostoc sp. ChiSLP01]